MTPPLDPETPPSPPVRKPGSPSVVFLLGAWIAAIASLAAVSILASITVAELSSGEARAINLAGSLRMQSYAIGAAATSATQSATTDVAKAVADFELRYRSADLVRVIPASIDDPLRRAYETVGELWAGRFKPAALRAATEWPLGT